MDGAAQANYAMSIMGNIGVPQPWPTQQKALRNVAADPQKGVGALDAQYPEVGTTGMPLESGAQQGVRPEDVGAKVISSVDGDTVTISAEGQEYVQQASAAADTPDTASATAKIPGADGSFVMPAGTGEDARPTETFFDLPQGGGIERADYEQPEVRQIQTAAVEDQAEERTALQLQPQEEPASAVEAMPEKEAAESAEVEPSDFRQYFNSELRQMLYRGQITQQQYDDEMESRKTEDDLKIDKKVV